MIPLFSFLYPDKVDPARFGLGPNLDTTSNDISLKLQRSLLLRIYPWVSSVISAIINRHPATRCCKVESRTSQILFAAKRLKHSLSNSTAEPFVLRRLSDRLPSPPSLCLLGLASFSWLSFISDDTQLQTAGRKRGYRDSQMAEKDEQRATSN